MHLSEHILVLVILYLKPGGLLQKILSLFFSSGLVITGIKSDIGVIATLIFLKKLFVILYGILVFAFLTVKIPASQQRAFVVIILFQYGRIILNRRGRISHALQRICFIEQDVDVPAALNLHLEGFVKVRQRIFKVLLLKICHSETAAGKLAQTLLLRIGRILGINGKKLLDCLIAALELNERHPVIIVKFLFIRQRKRTLKIKRRIYIIPILIAF